jgi:hypothetical protein
MDINKKFKMGVSTKIINMKTLLIKLKFKLASWLYDQGIIAPQLMERDSMIVLPSDYSDEDLEFYRKKQSEIKFKKHGNIND